MVDDGLYVVGIVIHYKHTMLGAACGQPQGRSRVVSGQVVNTGRTVAQQYHNDIAYYN